MKKIIPPLLLACTLTSTPSFAQEITQVTETTREKVTNCMNGDLYFDLRKLAGWKMNMDPTIAEKYPDLAKLLDNKITPKVSKTQEIQNCLPAKIHNELFIVAKEALEKKIHEIIKEYNRDIKKAQEENKPHEVTRLWLARQVVVNEFIAKYPSIQELAQEILEKIDKENNISPTPEENNIPLKDDE